ncbi:MAG: asparagine synthase (glutamine-hydrolyzing) [Magnetococcales bacterium]|nr:asparagine synthase (glutamine-hydrolyzing) [Magnetococcales bacterium]
MCGITGIVDFSQASLSREQLTAMTRSLRHRGPDGEGVWLAGPVGLGHTRLAVIDLSPSGQQPMVSEDGRVVLVYNGELYNFRTLREELIHLGAPFRGHSDTEVVLNAYLQWGTDAFARFNGMFALAIWDGHQDRLLLVRDPYGIKPLYHHRTPSGRLLFGSEIKALLCDPNLPRRMDPAALHETLWFGMSLGERTSFAGIHKLLPGHLLCHDRSGSRISRFAPPQPVPGVSDDPNQAAQGVLERLSGAVERHLVSDVPVGIFLSGGIDSSAITALAARSHGPGLTTFCVGFDFAGESEERPLAKKVARQFGTDHHELFVEGGAMPGVIEKLVQCHDAPFADPANIPLYLLCEALPDRIKVVLQGDGGDELFGGYRHHRLLALSALWQTIARGINRLPEGISGGGRFFRRLKRFGKLYGESDPGVRSGLLLASAKVDHTPARLLERGLREVVEQSDPFHRFREIHPPLAHLPPVERQLYSDIETLLCDRFLEKVDKATMAHGIEARVPFLDQELGKYALGLPGRFKARPRGGKWILKKALQGIVPDEILHGAKKGFHVPISSWLAGPLSEWLTDTLLTHSKPGGMLDREEVERTLTEHRSGHRDHGVLLWKGLQLALWMDHYRPVPPG